MEISEIKINTFEKYDSKKYRDDFGVKKNPLKTVVHVTVYFDNNSTLDLTLKFVESSVKKEQIDIKSEKILKKVGILEESD